MTNRRTTHRNRTQHHPVQLIRQPAPTGLSPETVLKPSAATRSAGGVCILIILCLLLGCAANEPLPEIPPPNSFTIYGDEPTEVMHIPWPSVAISVEWSKDYEVISVYLDDLTEFRVFIEGEDELIWSYIDD